MLENKDSRLVLFFCYQETNPPEAVVVIDIPKNTSPIVNFEGGLSFNQGGSTVNKKFNIEMKLLHSGAYANTYSGDLEKFETSIHTFSATGDFVNTKGEKLPFRGHISRLQLAEFHIYSSWALVMDSYPPPSFGMPIVWTKTK